MLLPCKMWSKFMLEMLSPFQNSSYPYRAHSFLSIYQIRYTPNILKKHIFNLAVLKGRICSFAVIFALNPCQRSCLHFKTISCHPVFTASCRYIKLGSAIISKMTLFNVTISKRRKWSYPVKYGLNSS